MNQDSPLVNLAKALEKLPVYTVDFVIATLVAIFTDFSITSLALGSAALWLATNLWWALAAFFVILVLCRTLNSVANAIGMTGQNVSALLRQPPAPTAPNRIVVTPDTQSQ